MPFFQKLPSFVTVLSLVIAEINYLLVITHKYYKYLQIPLIWLNKTKIVQKKVDLFVLAVSKNAISEKKIIMKYICFNLKTNNFTM